MQGRGHGGETAIEGRCERPSELCVEQEALRERILPAEVQAEAAVVELVAEIIGRTPLVRRADQHFVARRAVDAQITVGGGAGKLREAVPFEVGAAREGAASHRIAHGKGNEKAAQTSARVVTAEEIARELLTTLHHFGAIAADAHLGVHAAVGEVGTDRAIDDTAGAIDHIGAEAKATHGRIVVDGAQFDGRGCGNERADRVTYAGAHRPTGSIFSIGAMSRAEEGKKGGERHHQQTEDAKAETRRENVHEQYEMKEEKSAKQRQLEGESAVVDEKRRADGAGKFGPTARGGEDKRQAVAVTVEQTIVDGRLL